MVKLRLVVSRSSRPFIRVLRCTYTAHTCDTGSGSSVCVDTIRNGLCQLQPEMSIALKTNGYFTAMVGDKLIPNDTIRSMRSQAIALRNEGRFEPSWSESIDSVTGMATRFYKEGVFACEPDGADYETAPDLLLYMTAIISHLPPILNDENEELDLSNQAFNAKLAVTSPGGSVYPLHVDNIRGLKVQDVRKLTVILYLNPSYEEKDGGALRLHLANEKVVDVPPVGGHLVMFWSDEIPHEVLPTAPDANENDESLDRYALTIWLPTNNVRNIHSETSSFKDLRARVF
jgi:hypothetical protein